MKHLKKFENFDFGRFNDEDVVKDPNFEEQDFTDFDSEDEEFTNEVEDEERYEDEEQYEIEEDEHRIRRWGDEELVEKKKINAGFQAYLDKQKGKKADKGDDKKETMKKVAKDDKKDYKGKKGLTAGQKKAIQKAILKKNKNNYED